jgi:hypothetical protein
MQQHKFAPWKIWIGLAIALAIPFTVYAAHVTIDTDDGAVDSDWSLVTLFSADGDDWPEDNYDIDQAWVTNEADNSFFYFRASFVGSGRLPSSDNWSSLEAHLDCDQDGNDYGAADVIVIYYGQDGVSIECQGPAWPDCAPEPGSADWNAVTAAEEILGTPNNYEWQADVNNGNVSWAACFDTVDIRFLTLDSTGAMADTAIVREYDVPTAVNLEGFMADQHSTSFSFAAVLLIGLCVIASARLRRR